MKVEPQGSASKEPSLWSHADEEMGSRDVQIVAGVVVHKQYTVVDDAGIYPRKATNWVPKEAYVQKIFQTKRTDANRDINK